MLAIAGGILIAATVIGAIWVCLSVAQQSPGTGWTMLAIVAAIVLFVIF